MPEVDAPEVGVVVASHHPGGQPVLGYALGAVAAMLSGLNGVLGRLLLDQGPSPLQVTEVRSLVVVAVLGAVLAWRAPHLLRLQLRDGPWLAFRSVLGIAGTQATYFFAIDRIAIGAALVIQHLYPLMLLLWLRLAHGRRFPATLWLLVLCVFVGAALVARASDLESVDALGVGAAFASGAAFCVYLVTGEQANRRYPSLTVLFWGFASALVFWLVLVPVWNLPWGVFASPQGIALVFGVGVVGTLIPFALMTLAVQHVSAARIAIVLTLETLAGAGFAFLFLGETLTPAQLAGGTIMLFAICGAQRLNASASASAAPPSHLERRRSRDG